MILGNIKDIKRYLHLNKNLDDAVNFILNNDMTELSLGRHDITAYCYVNVMDYTVFEDEDNLFECHKLWGDIHLTAYGEEAIGICDLDGLTVINEYDQDKDILFGVCDEYLTYKLDNNHFAIVFDDDPHKVKIFTKDKHVRKIVFKFKL